MKQILGIISLAIVGGGCAAGVGAEPAPIVDQTEFDLTLEADRALFRAEDMEFRETLGPYAIFEVMGALPRMVGPRLRLWEHADRAWSMLCSSDGYFTPVADSPGVDLQLTGGRVADEVLVGSHHEALQLDLDRATGAQDRFGEPVPEAEQSEEPVTVQAIEAIHSIEIQFDPIPPVGALIPLRRLAVSTFELGHNDSHTTPRLRCSAVEGCALLDE